MRRILLLVAFFCAPQVTAAIVSDVHLRIQGMTDVSFMQCGEIGRENEIVTMNGGQFPVKVPGALRAGDIVCSRPINADSTLATWRKKIEDGDFNGGAKDGSLFLVGADGGVILEWRFTRGWPSKLIIDGTTETIAITVDTLLKAGEPVTPVITWATPTAITYGTALDSTQLNATTSAPGTFTYTPAAGTVLGAGVHTLTASFTPSDPTQFKPATKSVQLTVMKAVLTVKADNKQKDYGALPPPFTFAFSGFVNGDTASAVNGAPSLTSTATASSNVGSYAIVASLGTLTAANYTFAFTDGTLTIARVPLKAKANDVARAYGSPNPPLTGSLTGVVNNDNITVTFTTAATTQSTAGNYAITPVLSDPGARLTNYDVTLTNGTLTIEKVPLTVTADDKTMVYLSPLPPFTARYSGFVLNETASVLTGQPSFTTGATATSLPGTYPIVVMPGTLAAANYSFRFVNGTLTIIGPRQMLEAAARQATQLSLGASDPGDAKKYGNAASDLQFASDTARWRDEIHPRAADGQQVFQRAKDAVVMLTTLPQSSQTQALIDSIVQACRIIAIVAINESQDAKLVEKARQDLARGDDEARKARYANAILEYRAAWARFPV